jgi:ACS family hexuronate transporter-like MFS transporter
LGYRRRVLTRRYAWLVAIVATLTMTVSYIDRTALAVLAPVVTKALGISNEAYGWLGSAFSIAYLFGTPIAGWWIDRIGARRGLAISVLAWSTVAALHALVPSFGVLFVLRLALGLTEGPGFPGASQTVQRVLPPEDRERGFGVLFSGSSIGIMLVPLAVGLLLRYTSWHVAFLVTSLAGLVWLPAWLWVTRSSEVRTRLAPLPSDDREPRPAFHALVKHPVVLRGLAGVLAAAPVFSFASIWGAKYLVLCFGIEPVDVGHYLWLPPLMIDTGAILFGHLASRQLRPAGEPPRQLYAIAIALTASLGFLPLAHTPWDSLVVLSASSIGAGAMYTLTTADLLSRVPANSVSTAGGILAGAQSLALIISSPLIGRAVDATGRYDLAALCLGVWVLPGGVTWLLWKPPHRPAADLPRARALD